MSYTSMNLHYSQTVLNTGTRSNRSYTSMNLHYSQTVSGCEPYVKRLIPLWIYITLKLSPCWNSSIMVLYLYEFTLLSNIYGNFGKCMVVLYLYEFTLLSNNIWVIAAADTVLYLYEFTLLSNRTSSEIVPFSSYTSMNLHYSQTIQSCSAPA